MSVHHLTKFIPNLAELSEPLRPLLKKNTTTKNNKLDWKEEHTSAFNKKKQCTSNNRKQAFRHN